MKVVESVRLSVFTSGDISPAIGKLRCDHAMSYKLYGSHGIINDCSNGKVNGTKVAKTATVVMNDKANDKKAAMSTNVGDSSFKHDNVTYVMQKVAKRP